MHSKLKRSKEKILLPNGCWCSRPNVSPQNWNDKKDKSVTTDKDWSVQYRFYDPAITGADGKPLPHHEVFKGMNQVKNLADRRALCADLIENEIDNLKRGYNPAREVFIAPVATLSISEIHPETLFLTALEKARLQLKCADSTKADIKSALKYFGLSATNLQYNGLQIQQVRRKHVSLILNNCSNFTKRWSPHSFNHYRAYVMMVFKKLVELEAIESNPVDEHLPKENAETKVKVLPTDEEVKAILSHFAEDAAFTRFIHIFFHSGSREVELLRLKTTDVDLSREVFRVTVKKGNKTRQDERPIKKVALHYWQSLMAQAEPGQFLFGKKTMAPADIAAKRDYVTKKWQREVKKGLNINVDLYSLKHKNLDEIAAYLSIKESQKMAGHGSKVITMRYAINETKRANERVKDVPNVLGG
jgi:integrase